MFLKMINKKELFTFINGIYFLYEGLLLLFRGEYLLLELILICVCVGLSRFIFVKKTEIKTWNKSSGDLTNTTPECI